MKVKELVDIIERRYGNAEVFCANARRWLWEHKIPQLRVAERMGADPSNLNRWLRGKVTPTLINMLLIDEAIEELIEEQSNA